MKKDRTTQRVVTCPECKTPLNVTHRDGIEFECPDCGAMLQLRDQDQVLVVSAPLAAVPVYIPETKLAKERAPSEQLWLCMDCGRTAINAFGFADRACLLHAKLFDARRLVFGESGRVLLIKDEEEITHDE